MRVFVTGSNGFLGGFIVSSLKQAGHEVVRGVRRCTGSSDVQTDFSKDAGISIWKQRLTNIDAVVNCAGILREDGRGSFDAVHRDTPQALFQACAEMDICKVIQVSAIGAPEDTDFIRSKHEGDEVLMSLDLDWTVIRPSLVYSPAGSYGGTSLLRAMAALPFIQPLPEGGRHKIQPIAAEDLGKLVVSVLENDASRQAILEAVGPEEMTLEQYLLKTRAWLGYCEPARLALPRFLGDLAAAFSDLTNPGPLGRTMLHMLRRGNTGAAGPWQDVADKTRVHLRSLDTVLEETPSQVQDRLHARLYFLRPFLRICLGIFWILSGLIGAFATPRETALQSISEMGIDPTLAPALLIATCGLDIALGSLAILNKWITWVGALMLVSVLAYTIGIGTALPEVWLDPFGSITKNLVIIPAILVMMVLEERR